MWTTSLFLTVNIVQSFPRVLCVLILKLLTKEIFVGQSERSLKHESRLTPLIVIRNITSSGDHSGHSTVPKAWQLFNAGLVLLTTQGPLSTTLSSVQARVLHRHTGTMQTPRGQAASQESSSCEETIQTSHHRSATPHLVSLFLLFSRHAV